jgi:hypothetical protein
LPSLPINIALLTIFLPPVNKVVSSYITTAPEANTFFAHLTLGPPHVQATIMLD